jgi:hypothetical protein
MAILKPGVCRQPDTRRSLSRLILFFFTEYNARKRRASGMLIASFEADIKRKS